MDTGPKVGVFAVDHPRLIVIVIVGVTLILSLLAGLPSLWPHRFEPLHSLKVNTDPEDMLPEEAPVRVFHDRMKKIMSLNDMIVVGIVNEENLEHGVFNPGSLEKIYALSHFARGLRWRDPDQPSRMEGVVQEDMIAPSMVDNVESGGAGVVRFEWLMAKPPETLEGALEVKRKALNIPFLNGTLVSKDGKAVALYLPITKKEVSHRIYTTLEQKIKNPSRLFSSEVGNFNDTLNMLAAAAKEQGDPLIQMLWQELSQGTRQQILDAHKRIDQWESMLSRYESAKAEGRAAPELEERVRGLLKSRNAALKSFVSDINDWMQEEVSDKWTNPDNQLKERLDAEGKHLLAQNGGTLFAAGQKRLKRLWVEAAFGGNIAQSRVASYQGDEDYHITGLPVAEDTFGVEMFKQMAVSAPLAMLIIFVLMWFFFRSVTIVLPAMFLALISSAATMALLVITGNTVHIMSSMIPIFIVPIAVLDDVHLTSEFFDRYRLIGDRRKTVSEVMRALFTPMLYTTLTTSVGFASLALAPIPPVQVFGLFVAFGVLVAWVCTILLVPAYIALLPTRVLEGFGAKYIPGDTESEQLTLLVRVLRATGRWTYRWAKPIVAVSLIAIVAAGYGISLIRVNDNPTKWFEKSHPVRVATKVLNEHFGGTYMAYLSLRPEGSPDVPPLTAAEQGDAPAEPKPESGGKDPGLPGGLDNGSEEGNSGPSLPGGMEGNLSQSNNSGPSLPGGMGGKPEASVPPEPARQTESVEGKGKAEIFKDPATLRWIGALEDYMQNELGGLVGKSNSVTDIVETVHRELMVGVERDGRKTTRQEAMRVPDTPAAVAQVLLQFQNSHRPQDLWHFVTPDYRTGVLWLQLTSGDNRDMSEVAKRVNDWLDFWHADASKAESMVQKNPERFRPVLRSVLRYVGEGGGNVGRAREMIDQSPAEAVASMKKNMKGFAPSYEIKHDWFGLTYINVVWQEKMVKGMLEAFLGSFLAVFLMMTLLYRSALWGALCMAPLTVTIAVIYGLIGFVGKNYDMPVAVLSALGLGLAVDYSIHFLTRSRMMYVDYGSWAKTAGPVFGEPARAITRNAIVVGVGFLPLLLAPLVPYQTVGVFIAAILLLSGLSTMLILPGVMTLLEKKLFPRTQRACTMCNRVTCIIVILAAAALIFINVQQFVQVSRGVLTWITLLVIVVLAALCAWSSRGEKKRTETFVKDSENK